MTADLSVYLVTDSASASAAGHDLVSLVGEVARAGVSAVQVREKDATAATFLETVLRISEVLPEDVALIVNDRVDVFLAARSAGARVTGVHVGQSDLPVEAVRSLVGPGALVGVSASSAEQLLSAAASSARVDYVGIGALHPTRTKSDAPPALGHEGFAQLVQTTQLPAVAIGGVRPADLQALRRAGAAGAAVVSGLCSAADPATAARDLRAAWEGRS